ncbi:ribose-5-phosphate isomerase [Daktulosphaira vitifoliae]|uniref:ribose-5-phosphate isomerase n=1 Tax=Daktulosphaira vitifoliae TaxID=58002 RepID=UPI0021AAFC8B|nr:ribose-5-phosphate isomerase [Daktulosphaira vitifoliae]
MTLVQVKRVIIKYLPTRFVKHFNKMSAMNLCMNRKTEPAEINPAKKSAGYEAVNKYVKDGMTIGIGSGSTIVYSVQRLAERVKDEGLSVVCVPTSYQARQLINDYNLILGDLDTHPKLDCTIDGADEVQLGTLACIKGGGGCLTQEKIVASCSNKLIIVVDGSKESHHLGQNWKKGVPIEVIPMACKPTQLKIEEKFGGQAILRMSADKAGPLVTDNGNFLLDWVFPEKKICWSSVHTFIKLIPGVVETGLFIDMANECLVGNVQGNVKVLQKTEQIIEL